MTWQVMDSMRRQIDTGAAMTAVMANDTQRTCTMPSIDLLPLAIALLIGIPAFGSCIGIGLPSMKLLECVARQPELAPELQTKYFLAVGVTDGAFIIATGIGLWFATANPFQ